MNVQFFIAQSSQTRLPQNRSRIKFQKVFDKSEFLIVHESLTTRLTSGGCVEENSVNHLQCGKKSNERRGLGKLADAAGNQIKRS